MSEVLIAPSILSADFAKLAEAAALMEKAGADWLHVDVMDGHFVPNITIGPVVVKSLKKYTALPLDVHLMITDPKKYAEAFAKAGAWGQTFHLEAVEDPAAVIAEIKRVGCKPSVSIKPKTPAKAVLPFLKDLNVGVVLPTMIRIVRTYPAASVIGIVGGSFFVLGAVGLEAFSYEYLRAANSATLYWMEVALEEFLEMFGVTLMFRSVVLIALPEWIEVTQPSEKPVESLAEPQWGRTY